MKMQVTVNKFYYPNVSPALQSKRWPKRWSLIRSIMARVTVLLWLHSDGFLRHMSCDDYKWRHFRQVTKTDISMSQGRHNGPFSMACDGNVDNQNFLHVMVLSYFTHFRKTVLLTERNLKIFLFNGRKYRESHIKFNPFSFNILNSNDDIIE